MTTFDELIGPEPEGTEREQLRSVHDLLLRAGAPPELSPELAAGPPRMTLSLARRVTTSPRAFIPAIAAALLAVLIVGSIAMRHQQGQSALQLRGTELAPGASGTLEILAADTRKPRMRLEVAGLPTARYDVYLVRNNRPVAPCGSFAVTNQSRPKTVTFNSPYAIKPADTWIVTRARPDDGEGRGSGYGSRPGQTVMQPLTA